MRLFAAFLTVGLATLPHLANAQTKTSINPVTVCTRQDGTTLTVGIVSGFTPGQYFTGSGATGYQPPVAKSTVDANTAMGQDLTKALNLTSFFQQQLCGLDGVFIDITGCTSFDYTNDVCQANLTPKQETDASWGFRETPVLFPPKTPYPLGHPARYIAISAGPWSAQNTHAPPYSAYETMLLNQLLGWQNPQFISASPDTPEMAVLAALAHEFGHVLWFDTFVINPGQDAEFTRFCENTFFTGDAAGGGSRQTVAPPWQVKTKGRIYNSQNRWVLFGELPDDSLNSHEPDDVQTKEISDAIGQGSFTSAGQLLDRIYKPDGRWASYFASISPVEDFVETYKFLVLIYSQQPLNHLYIKIPWWGPFQYFEDVPGNASNGSKSELARKLRCFEKLLLLTPRDVLR